MKRQQGWAYRLYAYAVLEEKSDASLMDSLIDCLVQREDRSSSFDLGFRALRAMAKGHPLSDVQVSRLGAYQGFAAAEAAKLVKEFRPTEAPSGSAHAFTSMSLFYATDRTVSASAPVEARFGSDRASQLSFGICQVTVPHDHRIGNLELPTVLRLQFPPIRKNTSL